MAGQVSRTTPSVIIGMGGSGDWVLRQVKEALQRSHGGRVPSATQLIGIDTAATLPATARAGGQQQFVAPELSPGERARLNGNNQEITKGGCSPPPGRGSVSRKLRGAASVPDPNNVANVASWFVAEYYGPRLIPASYGLSSVSSGEWRWLSTCETQGHTSWRRSGRRFRRLSGQSPVRTSRLRSSWSPRSPAGPARGRSSTSPTWWRHSSRHLCSMRTRRAGPTVDASGGCGWSGVPRPTVFVPSPSRGGRVIRELTRADYHGVVTSDRYAGYNLLDPAFRRL